MAVTVLLGAQIALLVARALAFMARIRLLHRISGGEVVTQAQVQRADSSVSGAAGFWLLVFIATVVAWLIWQYRAQVNAQHLTTKKLTFSPGWAVGWWFIPFANLVQPFRAVRELWQASGTTGSVEGTWPVLVLWWIAWLGFNLVSVFARDAFDRATDAPALATADEGNLIAMVLGVASAAFAIAIVRAVLRRQESGMRAWPEAAAQIPPPPPPPPPPPRPE